MPKISNYSNGLPVTIDDYLVIARLGANYKLPLSSLGSGWTAVSDTWTRTGNFTFTVSGDVTATFEKGVKVRYKDGGSYEYGIVLSSSYSAPNTTVTLITNNDYAMAATTITDTYISISENPPAFPSSFNYTPTYSASGSMTYTSVTTTNAKFTTRGKWCIGRVIANGTTGGTASTQLRFTLPAQALDAADKGATFVLVADPTTYILGAGQIQDDTNDYVACKRYDAANFSLGANRLINAMFEYELE